jgi:hypothetical protein
MTNSNREAGLYPGSCNSYIPWRSYKIIHTDPDDEKCCGYLTGIVRAARE